ncbi:MAG: protease modulator HflC [Caulobacterales bacterium]|jgi:membrane protease subunit HflC
MPRFLLPVLAIAGLALFMLANIFFIVPQTQQVLVLQFGEAQRTINEAGGRFGPGLYMKLPFVQNTIAFDRRIMPYTIEEQEVIASDQERLIVDAFVWWRISDPLRFYQAAQTEEGGQARLERLTEAALRRALGNVRRAEIIATQRAQLMNTIREDVNRQASELGIVVVDVRLRQADLPRETQERVFARMATEREQVAAEIRAEGLEKAAKMRAEAEREAVVIRATAREEGEKIRGEGDAQRARIFAQSFGRDPDFAAFYRSMRAYEQALPEGTPMILPPESEFFRYFRDPNGRR